MSNETYIRKTFVEQAGFCKDLGSGFMHDLMIGLAEDLDRSTRTGRRVLDWVGNPAPMADALALRLAGGLHALARSERGSAIAPYYQTPERSGEQDFLPAILDAIREHDDRLYKCLDNAPQTNEVARASIIYAGLLELASQFDLPMALYELGCSGGLNLQCAQFGYLWNGEQYGDPDSPLQHSPKWAGSLPQSRTVEIVSRQGCDLNPLDVQNPDDAAMLIAYLWPDQQKRIERVEAAIEIAKRNPPSLEQADAAEWIERQFVDGSGRGLVRVLYDTIAWNYFPQDVKQRITAHMDRIGATATADNPLAWLTFEFEGDEGAKLTLQTWPGNGEREVLAKADSHVYGVEWVK